MMPDDFGPVINGRDNVWDDFVPFILCPPWVGACMGRDTTCDWIPRWFPAGRRKLPWVRYNLDEKTVRVFFDAARCTTGPVRLHRDRCSP